MNFFVAQKSDSHNVKLPVKYTNIPLDEKWIIRTRYTVKQNGLCAHCKNSLDDKPPSYIRNKTINWKLFPPNFQTFPQHLHHDHTTGMTIGTVHMLCNAVLWQYYEE